VPSFTEQWYPPGDERALRRFVGYTATPGDVIELGSHEGRSALILRDVLPDRRVLCVDAWPDPVVYARFLTNTDGHRIEHVRMTWDEFKREAVAGVAVVHIDMDHTYHQVCEQIRWAVEHLSPGGILVGHDYQPATPESPGWPDVVRAVDELIPERSVEACVWAAQR
jgi:predicted O-methyltransferase YrrM